MFHHPCSIPYLLQRKHASSFKTLSLPHPVLILRPQPPETPPSTLFCIFSLFFCDSTFPPACKCSPGSQTLQCPSSTPVFPPATSLVPSFSSKPSFLKEASSSLIRPSTHYAYHIWEMALGKKGELSIARFYVLVTTLLLQHLALLTIPSLLVMVQTGYRWHTQAWLLFPNHLTLL